MFILHVLNSCIVVLPKNGAPFNTPLVVEFKFKSTSAAGVINDIAVVDILHDIFTMPHTINNKI
jgi:hypothetical protein